MHKGKYITYLLIGGILFFIIIYFTGKYIVKNSWQLNTSSQALTDFCNEINSLPNLSNNFMAIFDSIHRIDEDNMVKKYNGLFLSNILGLKPHRYSAQIYYSEKLYELFPAKPQKWNSLLDRQLLFANAVEKLTSPKKCAQFYLVNATFALNDTLSVRGINSLSKALYNTDIQNLDRIKLIRLIAIVDINNYSKKIDEKTIRIRTNVLLHYLKLANKKNE